MKVLLLYKYSNHYHLLSDMMDDMTKRGLDIAALDVVHFNYHGSYLPFTGALSRFKILLKVPKVRGLLLYLFRHKLILKISSFFDVIDIQAFTSDYSNLIQMLISNQHKLVITYWGSDLFRASVSERNRQLEILHDVEMIRTTSSHANELVDTFGLTAPVSMCRFGVGNLALIKQRLQEPKENTYLSINKLFPKDIINKTVIVIGNNGDRAQQHLKILEEIRKIRENLKNVFLIIHASYGLDVIYRKEIVECLDSFSDNYFVLEKFLNRDQLNSLILLSDIYITAQTTDAFSAYVQEHLAAGTIVMAGEWLPYFVLREQSIYIRDFSIENLSEELLDVISDLDRNKSKSLVQNVRMFELSSWNSLGSYWYNSYMDLKPTLHT